MLKKCNICYLDFMGAVAQLLNGSPQFFYPAFGLMQMTQSAPKLCTSWSTRIKIFFLNLKQLLRGCTQSRGSVFWVGWLKGAFVFILGEADFLVSCNGRCLSSMSKIPDAVGLSAGSFV